MTNAAGQVALLEARGHVLVSALLLQDAEEAQALRAASPRTVRTATRDDALPLHASSRKVAGAPPRSSLSVWTSGACRTELVRNCMVAGAQPCPQEI
jgi:hypothetical protein